MTGHLISAWLIDMPTKKSKKETGPKSKKGDVICPICEDPIVDSFPTVDYVPIFIKLGSAFEVDLVLANSRFIDGSITERWKLIQTGTNYGDIRIKDESLLVNSTLFGSVEYSSFTRVNSNLSASSSTAVGNTTTNPPSSNPTGHVSISPPAPPPGDDESLVNAGPSSRLGQLPVFLWNASSLVNK
uniref:Uncharacterized protein n=1 Tax=Amphimedon queenslandica TaxID=400682 RepID=A0A1X7UE66_AMPQE